MHNEFTAIIEPGGVPASRRPEARLWISHRADRGGVFFGGRYGAGGGDWQIPGQAELHLKSLKVVLQSDHLRSKTSHRVRNEFYMHLIGYNLIRRVIAVAAFACGAAPWTVSFKGAQQTLNSLLPQLCSRVSTEDWCAALLRAIATHEVGNRPDRYEPRLVKRRPKKYKQLREPRKN